MIVEEAEDRPNFDVVREHVQDGRDRDTQVADHVWAVVGAARSTAKTASKTKPQRVSLGLDAHRDS